MTSRAQLTDGVIVGYDPGGDGRHGVAVLSVLDGVPSALVTETLRTAEDVVSRLAGLDALIGIGVDTLTCWSTGPSGWRPADRWLRHRYPGALNSVASPNSLFGSMGLNGMAVLIAARQSHPSLVITETHPKVLCLHLLGEKYDYVGRRTAMDTMLAGHLAIPSSPANDHEWDAALSALALYEGLSGHWPLDLHALPISGNERIVSPCGSTHYFWPSDDGGDSDWSVGSGVDNQRVRDRKVDSTAVLRGGRLAGGEPAHPVSFIANRARTE